MKTLSKGYCKRRDIETQSIDIVSGERLKRRVKSIVSIVDSDRLKRGVKEFVSGERLKRRLS